MAGGLLEPYVCVSSAYRWGRKPCCLINPSHHRHLARYPPDCLSWISRLLPAPGYNWQADTAFVSDSGTSLSVCLSVGPSANMVRRISTLVSRRWIVASTSQRKINCPWGCGQGQVSHFFLNLGPLLSLEWLTIEDTIVCIRAVKSWRVASLRPISTRSPD